jgi:hypothetical protein
MFISSTILLPKPNNAARNNIIFRTALIFQPLFVKLPLVAKISPSPQTRPYAVMFYLSLIHPESFRNAGVPLA